MSQENLDVVRRSTELWNEGDLAAFVALHHPDVLVVPPDNWPDGEVTRGREAWLRQGMRIKDSWESDRVELDHLHEAGSNVIVQLRWIAKGKDSGVEFETHFWVVYTLSAGSITRVEYFLDRSRAHDVAGISEQAMSQENVEIVQALWAAWDAGDVASATLAFHPDVRWHVAQDEPDADTRVGIESVGHARQLENCLR